MTEVKTVWFDRDKARNVLAMMKRGEAVRVNGIRVEFNEHGNFVTWDGLRSDVCSPSLKDVLNYLFGEHELPKAIEQSLNEVS